MARSPLFVTVEVGTSGARSIAVDGRGRIVAEVRRPYSTQVPRPGWAEQDANDWADRAFTSLRDLGRAIDGRRVAAIGLTGQSPTVVPVDADVRPLRPGMLYRDNRAMREADELSAVFGIAKTHDLTGHTPAAFHVGSKILWVRRHEPDVFARTRWFLQPRDVVLHRLTGRIATDETHANATALSDVRGRRWAEDLIVSLRLPREALPEILAPWTIAALLPPDVASDVGLPRCTPVVIGAGDSQCAAFGAGVVAPGPVSEMAGSSSCINTAVTEPVADERVTHYSHVVPRMFTTEVGLNTTGAAISWAVDALGFRTYRRFVQAADRGHAAVLAAAAAGEGAAIAAAPIFVPHLGDGERDDTATRGALLALSDRHGGAAIAYAVVEGVAAAVAAEVAILGEAGCPTDELRASGGATRIPLLGQLKADLLGASVLHLDVDASATGAALLAARSAGFDDVAAIAGHRVLDRATTFVPDRAFAGAAAARFAAWKESS